MTDLPQVWGNLQTVYMGELPDLAYRAIPAPSDVEESIRRLMAFCVNSALVCNRMLSNNVKERNRISLVYRLMVIIGRTLCACVLGVSCMAPCPSSKARLLPFPVRPLPWMSSTSSRRRQGQRIAPALFDDRIYRFPDSISRRICATDGTYALCP